MHLLKKYFILILIALPVASAAQNGTVAHPYTALSQVTTRTSGAVCYFSLYDSVSHATVAFSTFVNESGEMLIAMSKGNTGVLVAALAVTGAESNIILQASVLHCLYGISEVRITSTGGDELVIDLKTSSSRVIGNLMSNTTLEHGATDYAANGAWTGVGSVAAYCEASDGTTLPYCIIHPCGNSNGLHWIPEDGTIAKSFGNSLPSDGYLRLWVKGTYMAGSSASSGNRNWVASGNNIANTNAGLVSVGAYPTNLPSGDTSIKFAVNGTIYAKKLTVTQTAWADYVFSKKYRLRSIHETEEFILKNKHLPGVPSAKDIRVSGVSVGDNEAALLRKVEELTLYIIKLDKEIKLLQKEHKKAEPVICKHPAKR